MNDKPFKTYNEQMLYLREKKKISCEGSDDKQVLLRNGYFNLINGYKNHLSTRQTKAEIIHILVELQSIT